MPKRKADASPKGPPVGVRLPDDLERELQAAIAITGCDKSELLILCGRRALREVTREILSERQRAAISFFKEKRAA